MRLVSMIDRVDNLKCGLQPFEEVDVFTWHNLIKQYANFLNQPLNLGMFVPAIEVEGKWEVLECPPSCDRVIYETDFCQCDLKQVEQYQLAKDKVLFEGFEITKVDDLGYYNLRNETAIIEVYNPLDAETEFLDILDNGLETINDLIKYALTLTAKGQELSGLNK